MTRQSRRGDCHGEFAEVGQNGFEQSSRLSRRDRIDRHEAFGRDDRHVEALQAVHAVAQVSQPMRDQRRVIGERGVRHARQAGSTTQANRDG